MGALLIRTFEQTHICRKAYKSIAAIHFFAASRPLLGLEITGGLALVAYPHRGTACS